MLSVPQRVAIPLRNRVKAELDHMEKRGVTAHVGEPTEWCAGMVPRVKNIRKTAHLCGLNTSY